MPDNEVIFLGKTGWFSKTWQTSLLRDFPQEIGQLNSIFVESYDFFQPIKWSLWNVIILKLFRIKPPRELKRHVCQPSRNQTKASYTSSCGMNRPIPSWLMYVTCSFVLMKMKSFSCETFCMSTRFKKRQTATRKWNLSLLISQVAHQAVAYRYPGFCSMKWLRVFLLPPWIGC